MATLLIDSIETYPAAATVQFLAGTASTGIALAFACPSIAAAGLVAFVHGDRYVGQAGRWSALRVGFVLAATFSIVAIVLAIGAEQPVSGWILLAVALVGLMANAASAFAALGLHFSRGNAPSARAADTGYLLLVGCGVLLLVYPAEWVCLFSAALIAAAALAGGVGNAMRSGVPA